MASALHQLIAQQRGPDIAGAALQGLVTSDQQKAAARQAEMDQQRITLGQRQLAQSDEQSAVAKKQESLKLAASLRQQINAAQDPAQKAQIYAQAKQSGPLMGVDTSWWPAQYDEQAQVGLDNAFNYVYGDQMVKADLARKPKGPVSVGSGGTLVNPETGEVVYQAPEKGMTDYQRQSLDLRQQALARQGGSNNFKVVGGRLIDISTGEPVDVTPAGAASGKPLPVPLQKLEGEDVEAIQTANTIQADLGEVRRQIDSGELPLGPVANMMAGARNTAGLSSEASRKFATLKATLERLRNDSLRLNKGVQTDGDAQRAWNELAANINDPQLVSERLAEIQSINERGAALRAQAINMRRLNNGVPTIDDFSQFEVAPAIGQGAGKPVDAKPAGKYKVGDVIDHGGVKYRVVGGDPNDPDVEPVE